MDDDRRSELGRFLRARRERLRPEACGLVNVARRRTPGLRREEVAELAGIGVDWYTRLEQGRDVQPSAATIDALADALRLTDLERAHLRALGRGAGPGPFGREAVPDTIRRLVLQFASPAYVTGRRFDLLAWNAPAAALFTDFERLPELERNILLYVLTDPSARRLFGATWFEECRRMVGQFRVAHDLRAGDPSFAQLVDRLSHGNPHFVDWWRAHDIRGVSGGRKSLDHPERGLLQFDYATFQANDDPGLKLTIYVPADVPG